jgi:hypothetical protein
MACLAARPSQKAWGAIDFLIRAMEISLADTVAGHQSKSPKTAHYITKSAQSSAAQSIAAKLRRN